MKHRARVLWTATMLMAMSAAAAVAQPAQPARADTPDGGAFDPNRTPVLEITRSSGPIRVDGELDDAGWADAAVATGFSEFQPRQDVAAGTHTEAWVTYDAKNLYFAFVVRDDPSSLRTTMRDRDDVWNDDWVIAAIDTYGDNSWAYMIGANPLGVQLDARFSNSTGDDPSLDVVYESAGRVTDEGYVVELAVPFASLRFPDAAVQEWKINFVQHHPRDSRRQYSWAALSMDNNCVLCQSGTLLGLEGVEPGGQLELLPSLVAGQGGALDAADDPTTFSNSSPTADLSLGMRYPFKSGWTAEATYNPDFSQIESDASQIDVNTTFALSFPERRPFFQEGADLFSTWVNAIYTRSINNPIGAGKLLGRQGNLSMGWIGAVDENSPLIIPLEERSIVRPNGQAVSNIFRARQMFGSGSSLGGLLTDRRFDGGGSGTTFGADALIRINQLWQLEAQVVGSYTREPEVPGQTEGLDGVTFGDEDYTATFDGEAYLGRASYVSLERNARGWNFDADYWDATPTYRADNGFQGQNNFRRAVLFNGYSFWPENDIADQIFIGNRNAQVWNFDGVSKLRNTSFFIESSLKGQTHVSLQAEWGEERYQGMLFSDLVGGGISIGSNFSEAFGFNAGYGRGRAIYRADPQVGQAERASLSATVKPLQNLVVAPSINWQRLDDAAGVERYNGFIARTRVNFQPSRRIVMRLVTEWNDFSQQLAIEPMLLYRINPFSVLYLGSTHGYREFDEPYALERTSRQFFLKMQYLIRP